jgi:glycosyltransferase involved in cell wall biosynthesis
MDDAALTVSVVIPCRNAERTLGQQLDALAVQSFEGHYEVIVSDNGSTDRSRAVAEERRARVVDASRRRGPNHARNAGASEASGDLILTCDADDVVDAGWIEAMVDALAIDDVVGGRLERSLLNAVGSRSATGQREDAPAFGSLPAAAGANFGIRATVLRKLGGWDESFEGGPDEIELCWRAQLEGFTIGFAPDAIVFYRYRSTTAGLARQMYRRASFLPMLFRRFRSDRRFRRRWVPKAVTYLVFILTAWPAAFVSRRWRRLWVQRTALGVGFVRGLLRREADPILGLRVTSRESS